MDTFWNGKLHFLDMEISESGIDDFRKITHTGQYSVYEVIVQIVFFEITPTGMYQLFSEFYWLPKSKSRKKIQKFQLFLLHNLIQCLKIPSKMSAGIYCADSTKRICHHIV